MGTAQDDDFDFKWRPPTGDGVLGKKDDYQADDNEVFRVDEEALPGSAAYPAAEGEFNRVLFMSSHMTSLPPPASALSGQVCACRSLGGHEKHHSNPCMLPEQ